MDITLLTDSCHLTVIESNANRGHIKGYSEQLFTEKEWLIFTQNKNVFQI